MSANSEHRPRWERVLQDIADGIVLLLTAGVGGVGSWAMGISIGGFWPIVYFGVLGTCFLVMGWVVWDCSFGRLRD